MIITIDGPAGAGKSTVGKRLAERLGFRFFESGAVYRALAVKVLRAGINPQKREEILALIPGREELTSNPEFYLPETTRLASILSADPEVRKKLILTLVPMSGSPQSLPKAKTHFLRTTTLKTYTFGHLRALMKPCDLSEGA